MLFHARPVQPLVGERTPRKGLAKAVKFLSRVSGPEGTAGTPWQTHQAFEAVEDAFRVEQADGVARDQASHRVAHHAQLGDVAAAGLDSGQLVLDLDAHALAARLDAIVGEVAGVGLNNEEVELVLVVLGAEGLC